MSRRSSPRTAACALSVLIAVPLAQAAAADAPWLDPHRSPEERARLADAAMTDAERLSWLHGPMAIPLGRSVKLPKDVLISAGYYPPIPRLGLPEWYETDASLGVANPADLRKGERSTILPSGLATAASFNPEVAYANGAMVGAEAWAKGFNVLLGGGVNLTREPRNGRNFEYLGEDPLLAGTLDGEAIRGTQAQHVVSTVKHYALNDQETQRHTINAVIDEAALRESDLLAFEIAIERGQPGSVMCSYNFLNGQPACGSDFLLNKVLKQDWGYTGWVMSDWGAVHGVKDAASGLDQESGEQIDKETYFLKLPDEVAAGRIPAARLSDMSRRILRGLFAAGAIDHPARRGTEIDFAAHAEVARRAEAEGLVLLRNRGDLLPLTAKARTVLVVGGYANRGVLSGAGSAQVLGVGGPALSLPVNAENEASTFGKVIYQAGAPTVALKQAAPGPVEVLYDGGEYPSQAAAAARRADVVVIFATRWEAEGADVPDLTLPNGQDAMIEAVAAANPNTIVVLETGGPVAMPWLDKVGAVMEAWYPGQKGAEVIADVIWGKVNPSGRLPITFPASLAQLPHPALPGADLRPNTAVDAPHPEGSDTGYRWYARQHLTPLFPFGHGLGYSRFAYGNLKVEGGTSLTVRFDVTNTGARDGMDTPQAYLTSRPGGPLLRLVGFQKVALKPGETKTVTLTADRRLLADFDVAHHGWSVAAGAYTVGVGASSADLTLTGVARVSAQRLKP